MRCPLGTSKPELSAMPDSNFVIDARLYGLSAGPKVVRRRGPVFLTPHDSIQLTHPCFFRFLIALQPTGPLSNRAGQHPGKPAKLHASWAGCVSATPVDARCNTARFSRPREPHKVLPTNILAGGTRKGSNSYREPPAL